RASRISRARSPRRAGRSIVGAASRAGCGGMRGSVAGRGILLTRAEADCLEWAQRLEDLGALPVVFPCIECRDLDAPQLRARLAKALPAARWLIFTSRRGVAAFAALQQMPLPEGVKVAVVGPATARAARDVLGRADLEGP